MDIYKIMIVDDEADVREGIVQHLDWARLGLRVVGEAENGLDALDKAEAQEIDIVLTDIKMPFMDGIRMCERLSAMYPALKIIFLTGFDEFEYAKAAISLNAVEYVLKPVNVAELTEVLRRVRELIDKSVEEKRDMEALRANYEQTLPLMRERFLNELIWGIVPEEEVQHQLIHYKIALAQPAQYVAAVFELETAADGAAAVNWELAPLSMKRVAEETLFGRCEYEAFLGTSAIIAITAWKKSDPIAELMRLSNEICSQSARVLGLTVSAGIGRPQDALKDIHHSFADAKAALEYKVIAGSGQAIYIQDMEREAGGRDVSFDSRSEQQLLSVVKFGTYEQLRRTLEDILMRIDGSGEWERQAYLIGVFNAVYRIIQRYKLHAEEAVMERMQTLLNAPGQWNDMAATLDLLSNICSCMSEYINAKRVTATKSFVEEAKRYIGEHYADSSLSLERLCQHLHVSQTYFSAVFKQETGLSYVQYLTETRLGHAAALLQETDEKTYVIARQVGYEEPNYFSYVFKKRYGISPTKYRK